MGSVFAKTPLTASGLRPRRTFQLDTGTGMDQNPPPAPTELSGELTRAGASSAALHTSALRVSPGVLGTSSSWV